MFRIFLGYQWVLLTIQYIFAVVTPDTSSVVEIQKQRIEFINEKVIEKVPDEEEFGHSGIPDDEESTQSSWCCCGGKKKPGVLEKYERGESINEFKIASFPTTSIDWPANLTRASVDGQDPSTVSPVHALEVVE